MGPEAGFETAVWGTHKVVAGSLSAKAAVWFDVDLGHLESR
jgi:hypothetical protein